MMFTLDYLLVYSIGMDYKVEYCSADSPEYLS
jgi:hypothetical protein